MPTDHPPAADLRAYALGQLADPAAAAVAAHLADCPACTAAAAAVTADAFVGHFRAAADPDRTGSHRGPEPDAAGATLAGKYKLLERIGEGGMGAVYMADQLAPVKRRVAVKLIRPDLDSKLVLARFEAERQALALMDHPNIAKVLDAGAADDGRPFFVMELVKGVPVTEFADARKLGVKARLNLFTLVCQAVQHAHQKGVIHRDIKPSNVLVALYDGVPVPKVIDFGVAKAAGPALTDKTLFTGYGAVVGTPEYMSPEQAELNQLDIDTRSDVYALGVLLYELLTGTTPVTRERLKTAALLEVLRVVREEEPPRPSARLSSSATAATTAERRGADPARLARSVRGDLDWIVMKALEKDRARRYDTAAAFAADVGRHLADEPVLAGPPSAWYRARKLARRNRAAATAAAVVLAALVAGIGGTTWQAVRATTAESAARAGEAAATEARDAEAEQRRAAERLAASVGIDLDMEGIDDKVKMLRLAKRLPTIPEHARELREFAAYQILVYGQQEAPLGGELTHDGFKSSYEGTSADGRSILTTAKDGTARVWNTRSCSQLAVLSSEVGRIWSADFLTADGRLVAIVLTDYTVQIWDAVGGRLIAQTTPHPARPDEIVVSRDGRRLLTACPPDNSRNNNRGRPRLVQLWDAAKGHRIAVLYDCTTPVCVNSFSPDSAAYIIGHTNKTVTVHTAADGRVIHTLGPFPRPAQATGFSPEGSRAFSLSGNEFQWWQTNRWAAGPNVKLPDKYMWTGSNSILGDINFLTEQVVAIRDNEYDYYSMTVIDANASPVCSLGFNEGYVITDRYDVVEIATNRRLPKTVGGRTSPEARRFATNDQFILLNNSCYDINADKILDSLGVASNSTILYDGSMVSSKMYHFANMIVLPGLSNLPQDSDLALWAGVIARGSVDEFGNFVPLDEATWEAARRALARLPARIDGFPFPGSVSVDTQYWLRREIAAYTDDDDPQKLRLLDRLVAAEPTWSNYYARCEVRDSQAQYVPAVQDELEVARLAGSMYRHIDAPSAVSRLIRRPGRPRTEYEIAERVFAARRTANIDIAFENEGLLHTRLGRPDAALATLQDAEHPLLRTVGGMLAFTANLPAAVSTVATVQQLGLTERSSKYDKFNLDPDIFAIRAIAYHQLGQPADARRNLDLCRQKLRDDKVKADDDRTRLYDEARALIEGRGPAK